MTQEKTVSLPEGLEFVQVIDGETVASETANGAQDIGSDVSSLIDLLMNPPEPVNEALEGEPAAQQEQAQEQPAAPSARIDEPPKISARTLHTARLQVRAFDLVATLGLTLLSGSFDNYNQLKGAKKDLEELALIWGEICELEGIKTSPYIALIAGIGAIYAPAAVQAWQLRQQKGENSPVFERSTAPATQDTPQQEKPGREPVMPKMPRRRGVPPGAKRGSYKKGGQKA